MTRASPSDNPRPEGAPVGAPAPAEAIPQATPATPPSAPTGPGVQPEQWKPGHVTVISIREGIEPERGPVLREPTPR